jgi:hypothetical protein
MCATQRQHDFKFVQFTSNLFKKYQLLVGQDAIWRQNFLFVDDPNALLKF